MDIKTSDSSSKNKLFLGFWFVLYAFLLLLVSWLFHIPVNNADEVLAKIENTENQISKLSAIHAKFLLNNNKEDNPFVVSNKDIQLETQTVFRNIKGNITYIRNKRSFNHKKELASAINEFSLALTNYEVNLSNLILITQERGSKKSGIVMRWLEASHKLISSENVNDEILQKLIQIRQLESDYLIYRDIKILENISITIEDIRGLIISDEESTILNDLDQFTALTNNLASIEKRLGVAGTQGIVPDLEKSIRKLPEIFGHIAQLAQKQESRIRIFWNVACYVVIFLIVSLFIYLFINVISLVEPLKRVSGFIKKLAAGELPEEDIHVGNLSDMITIRESLKKLIASLHEKLNFVNSMNRDVLDSKLTLSGKNDLLGNELIQLQQKIKETLLKQAKNEEDSLVRQYMNEGLAKFADVLRSKDNDIALLGDAFIQGLVKYLNAIQGGFFLFDDTVPAAPVLKLVSAFAYNRKKYLQQTIAYGEGLVGTCAREKQYINLTEIPPGYITITSGLGDTPPGNLLLVPVLHENELLGVIEITSLITLKQFEIDFAQEVAHSLGSTLVNARNNQKTAELLAKSQQQALEMAEQEEEMRQNMEELKATQEESIRREDELRGIALAVENALMVLTYDLEGKIIDANEQLCFFIGREKDDIIGKNHIEVFSGTLKTDDQFWDEVQKKGHLIYNEKIRVGKKTFLVLEHFASVINRSSNTVKYLNFVTDGRIGNS